jgi:CubicO group peptidase (beta-lactamase class C family)
MATERLTETVATLRERLGIPGLCVAVSEDDAISIAADGVLHAETGAEISEQARFQLACGFQLLITVLTLLSSRNDENLLDMPIGRLLPEIGKSWVGREVTSRHLLTHTAGYVPMSVSQIKRCRDKGDLVDYLNRSGRHFSPGRVFDYTYTNAALLALVLRSVHGKAVDTLADEHIFDPLGITTGSAHSEQDAGESYAGRHLKIGNREGWKSVTQESNKLPEIWEPTASPKTISVADLARVLRTFLTPTSDCGKHLFLPEVYLPRYIDNPAGEGHPIAFALGAAMYDSGLAGATGSSLCQTVIVRMSRKSGKILVAGANMNDYLMSHQMSAELRETLLGEKLSDKDESIRVDNPDDFVGEYLGQGGQKIVVTRDKDRLLLELRHADIPLTTRFSLVNRCEVFRTEKPNPYHSLALFREPHANLPAIMVNMFAHRKL